MNGTLIHLYGGPLDGGVIRVGEDCKQLVVRGCVSYLFSEVWSCYFKRPTWICNQMKGNPPHGKGVSV